MDNQRKICLSNSKVSSVIWKKHEQVRRMNAISGLSKTHECYFRSLKNSREIILKSWRMEVNDTEKDGNCTFNHEDWHFNNSSRIFEKLRSACFSQIEQKIMLLPINNINEKSHPVTKKGDSVQITVLPFVCIELP